MTDLEQDLRDLLETKARDGAVAPKPASKLLKRAHRRQIATVLTAIIGTAAVVVGSVAGLQAVTGREPSPNGVVDVPVLPDAPEGFRPAVLPYASIVYPKAWSLLVSGEGPQVLQLTNFDPEFAQPCLAPEAQGLPPLGVFLEIERRAGPPEQSLPTWPVSLERGLGSPACGGAQEETFGKPEHFEATWRDGSATFVARADIGPLTPSEARQWLFDSFSSLQVVDDDTAQLEHLLGSANLVLDATDTPVGPVTLYAYTDGEGPWIGIAGPAGSDLLGAAGGGGGRGTPDLIGDADVTMNLEEWGAVVWGTVAASIARAELRTVEGLTFPARLIPLPASLEVEHAQAVWGVVEGATADSVTTLLYDETGNVLTGSFPTGPRVTIATGTDPEGGDWELYLETTNLGVGLGYTSENSGGGGGCCLEPLEGDLRLGGWGPGSSGPSRITVLASELVARVVFEAASGEEVEGQISPIPDESLGVPQAGIIFVPRGIPLEGDVVAYDAEGNELGREFVGDVGEPAGPTPEIDAVWRSLRVARDAAGLYFADHGSFDTVTPDALLELAEGSVTFTTRPEPEAVLIFVTDELHLVLSSATITGELFCVGVEADGPGGGLNYRYGSTFARAYGECGGGWEDQA